jgi:hypothetical protein
MCIDDDEGWSGDSGGEPTLFEGSLVESEADTVGFRAHIGYSEILEEAMNLYDLRIEAGIGAGSVGGCAGESVEATENQVGML